MVLCDISEFEGKTMLKWGVDKWLNSHSITFQKYLDENLSKVDRTPFKESIKGNELQMILMRKVLDQYTKSSNDKVNDIIDDMFKYRGKLYMIVGSKRSGKTAFAYKLCEALNTKHKEKVWWFGPPATIPPFIEGCTLNENKLPAVCTIIADEAGIQFWSRISGNNTNDFLKKLPVMAHTSRNVIVITQSTAITDLNFIRLSDGLFYKTYSVFQNENERIKLSDQLRLFMPKANQPEKVLFYDSQNIYTINFTLPEWWNDKYSKPYRKFNNKGELYRFVLGLIDDEVNNPRIIEQTELRGSSISNVDIETIRMIADHWDLKELLKRTNSQIVEAIEEGFDDTPLNDLATENKPQKIKANWEVRPRRNWAQNNYESDEDFKIQSMLNVNQQILSDINHASEDSNITAMICGMLDPMRGIHKSDLAISFASIIQQVFTKRKMSASRIKYDNDELMESIKEGKKGDTYVRDENPFEGIGVGAGRQIEELRVIIEGIRQAQKNFIFCGIRYGSEQDYDYILEPWGIDEKQKLIKALVFIPSISMSKPFGYITLRWTEPKLWGNYQKIKNEYLNKIQSRKGSGKSTYHIKCALELIEDEDYMSLTSKKDKSSYIANLKYENLTGGEIDQIVSLTYLPPEKLEKRLNPTEEDAGSKKP